MERLRHKECIVVLGTLTHTLTPIIIMGSDIRNVLWCYVHSLTYSYQPYYGDVKTKGLYRVAGYTHSHIHANHNMGRLRHKECIMVLGTLIHAFTPIISRC